MRLRSNAIDWDTGGDPLLDVGNHAIGYFGVGSGIEAIGWWSA